MLEFPWLLTTSLVDTVLVCACKPTCNHDDMWISSCDNVLITRLKEAANVLSVDAVTGVADQVADMTLGIVDMAIDEANTVIDCRYHKWHLVVRCMYQTVDDVWFEGIIEYWQWWNLIGVVPTVLRCSCSVLLNMAVWEFYIYRMLPQLLMELNLHLKILIPGFTDHLICAAHGRIPECLTLGWHLEE